MNSAQVQAQCDAAVAEARRQTEAATEAEKAAQRKVRDAEAAMSHTDKTAAGLQRAEAALKEEETRLARREAEAEALAAKTAAGLENLKRETDGVRATRAEVEKREQRLTQQEEALAEEWKHVQGEQDKVVAELRKARAEAEEGREWVRRQQQDVADRVAALDVRDEESAARVKQWEDEAGGGSVVCVLRTRAVLPFDSIFFFFSSRVTYRREHVVVRRVFASPDSFSPRSNRPRRLEEGARCACMYIKAPSTSMRTRSTHSPPAPRRRW